MADHTITLSAANETQLDRARLALNERLCVAAGLPITATKAEVTAVNPDLGAEFTNDVDGYIKQVAKAAADGAKAQADAAARDKVRAAVEVVIATGTNAQKNALCQAVGLPNGSLP